jgi:hypothetical protein
MCLCYPAHIDKGGGLLVWEYAISSFLNISKPSSATEYEAKLRIFHEYLIDNFDITDKNYNKIMSDLNADEILDSVVSYITGNRRKKIEYSSPVRVYRTAVLEYLRFLANNKEYHINNSCISDVLEQKDLRKRFEALLKEYELKDSEADVHITKDECEALIRKCNFYIETPDDDLSAGDVYNKRYSKFLSAIVLKFVLTFGISSETLNNLTLSDYDTELNKVKINKFTVHMPDDLSSQMKKYLRIRTIVIADKVTDRLFVRRQSNTSNRTSTSSKLSSSNICDVLEEVTGKKSVRSVAKYAIIEMIKVDIPQHLITGLTGFSYEVYKYCLGAVNDEPSNADSKLLDSKLRLLWYSEQ